MDQTGCSFRMRAAYGKVIIGNIIPVMVLSPLRIMLLLMEGMTVQTSIGWRSKGEIFTVAQPRISRRISKRADETSSAPPTSGTAAYTTSPTRPRSEPRTTLTCIPALSGRSTNSTGRSVAPSINRNRSICTSGTTAGQTPPAPARFIRKRLTPCTFTTSRRSCSAQRTNTTDGITTRSTSRRRPSRHTLTSRCKATYTS